jgi:hypothetical protein
MMPNTTDNKQKRKKLLFISSWVLLLNSIFEIITYVLKKILCSVAKVSKFLNTILYNIAQYQYFFVII